MGIGKLACFVSSWIDGGELLLRHICCSALAGAYSLMHLGAVICLSFGDFLAVLGEIDEDLDFWEYCRGNHIPR